MHTGDCAKATYWRDGKYQLDAIGKFNTVLRDWRSGDVIEMDVHLFDLLHRLGAQLDATGPFEVVCGYRSPATNAQLAAHSSGVAKHSLHMRGMAVDIRLPGVQLAGLRQAALDLGGGGVGYYPRSGFVHVDTGRVRSWGPKA